MEYCLLDSPVVQCWVNGVTVIVVSLGACVVIPTICVPGPSDEKTKPSHTVLSVLVNDVHKCSEAERGPPL